VQEAHSVFALYYVPMLLLSGWVAPISLTPPWIQALAMVMPFRYTTAVPVEIALGKLSGDAMFAQLLGQALWVAAAILLGVVLWRRGLRVYAGVGM
jgi:ABC-2 type transport system permease protein